MLSWASPRARSHHSAAPTPGHWALVAADCLDRQPDRMRYRSSGSTGTPRWHAHRLADLAPHIGQAFLLTDQMQATMERDERLRGLMDSLCFGIVLCGEDGRVQWLNRQATALLVPGVARGGVSYDECFERSAAEVKADVRGLIQAAKASGPLKSRAQSLLDALA